ncbi:MAG: GNAT family N-acetyltransferase, partial [Acetobacteraceae bacterium]
MEPGRTSVSTTPVQERISAAGPRTLAAGGFELLEGAGFAALKPEWDELWQRASGEYLMQTHDWAAVTLANPPDARPRRACCVVGWRSGRIDAIWPFVVYSNNRWRVATTIAAEWGDYTSPLVEDGPDLPGRTRAAWEAARRLVRADLFDLRFVRESTPLHPVIAADPAPKETLYQLEAPWIALKDYRSWEDYWHGIDPAHRRDLGRKGRRLAEQGRLEIHEITDQARGRELIDWMIENKRIWLDHV